MLWLKHRMKTVSLMLIVSMLNLCLISTNAYSSQREAQINHDDIELGNSRQKLKDLVNRQDIQKQLQQYGLSKEEAQNRIDALTDEEIAEVVNTLEQLPAGGQAEFGYFIGIAILLVFWIIKTLWCAVALPFIDRDYTDCLVNLWNREAEISSRSFEEISPIPITEFKVRHILVNSESEAFSIIDQLQSGSNFQELAKKYSTGLSASKGGDLGWLDPDALDPQFSKALWQIQKGEISKIPVKTKFGWHIIFLEDEKSGFK